MSNCNFTTSRQAGRQASTNRRKLVQNQGTKQDTNKDKENKEKQGRINGQKNRRQQRQIEDDKKEESDKNDK